ncbi:hypothetical protein EDD75_0784 [Thermodesulfitimonas autotrophica]|uniref:Uncharacterized protein n=1 Tax=Thermodesulfitimonas autotrophica TaxID=1894989 RepID=A0A3N5AP08_9THEO|nr:hypothetical protein [Thermodesulfitimonas autotrophica]RPF46547.1 hypothetical protein EDD75_0784 [Thermodesulfitimonas autotrophica]
MAVSFQMTSRGAIVNSSPKADSLAETMHQIAGHLKNNPTSTVLEKMAERLKSMTKEGNPGDASEKNWRIAVEFECGGCCKKVLNAACLDYHCGNFLLWPEYLEYLVIKTFSCGEVVERECALGIIIPASRVCSIEFGAMQVDP